MAVIRLLTSEEKEACGFEPGVEVAISVNDSNKIIGLFTLDLSIQYNACNNCKGRCGQGGVVWTRTGNRGSGVFSNLYKWTLNELGIDRLYAGGGGLPSDARAIWNRFDIVPPKNPAIGTATYPESTNRLDLLVERISPILGYTP